ncbi:hypothetical protein EDB86DRAFT_562329 [Lactarius hatsudake]|nr:hypothetical protein EDB86DRAFT_562329 [Lactarius hatsudake]
MGSMATLLCSWWAGLMLVLTWYLMDSCQDAPSLGRNVSILPIHCICGGLCIRTTFISAFNNLTRPQPPGSAHFCLVPVSSPLC